MMEETSKEAETFKAPLLNPSSVLSSITIPLKSDDEKTAGKSIKQEKIAKKKLVNVPLPYKEPDWGGSPPPNFNFEVIKNGTFVCTTPIKSSFFVFGRLDVCDVIFEHPSVSRYHAIVQYCKGDDQHPKGFYLYDLGSTHGTFLNKNPVKSKIYYKLKVGYILKFGGSSRLHIFQGPEEVEEIEDKKPTSESRSEPVCSWGMGDDDEVEEEDASMVNPFALSSTNEELYLDDPKKTLKRWFEREGYDLEYNVEEKGYQTFMCTVELPVDTPTGEFLPVEASVSGKKKEAVVACALEACRTLDRLGLLRKSHHESRQRKKKKWEENDYYDSDEDTFYDRTGEIEKRREMRKKLTKKNTAENFKTIETKLKDIVSEIKEVKQKLDACTAKNSQTGNGAEEDSLETYMSNLAASANVPTDKFQRRKLMIRLTEAEKEKTHLEKLLNIARPATLPPVSKHPGMIGRRPKSKLHFTVSKPKDVVKVEEKNDNVEEEEESDNEVNDQTGTEMKVDDNNFPEKMETDECDINNKTKKYGLLFPGKDEVSKPERTAENRGNQRDEDLEPTNSETISPPIPETVVPHKKHKGIEDEVGSQYSLPNASRKANTKKHKKEVDVYKTETAEYSTWTPPANQSGDGKTHLNAKYGY